MKDSLEISGAQLLSVDSSPIKLGNCNFYTDNYSWAQDVNLFLDNFEVTFCKQNLPINIEEIILRTKKYSVFDILFLPEGYETQSKIEFENIKNADVSIEIKTEEGTSVLVKGSNFYISLIGDKKNLTIYDD